MSPEIRSFCRARSLSIRSTRRANPLSGSRYHLSTTQGKCASTSCLNKPYKSTLSPAQVGDHSSVPPLRSGKPDSRRISAQARLIEGNAAQPGGSDCVVSAAGENIVAGYSTLKDRVALEKIRDHRRRLLDEYRMRDRSVLKFDRIKDDIRDEIAIVEATL